MKSAKVNLKPASGVILIEPTEKETKTSSGIYIPDTASSEKPQKGKVLAIGENEISDHGVERKAPCRVGDIVYYKKWGGNEVKIDNKDYLFIKFEDVLAIEN